MAKDIRDGVEYVDETPVSAYVARVSGSFDLDPLIAQTFVRGDLHTFLVTVRHDSRQQSSNKGVPGTVKLTETMKVEDATFIDREKAIFMLDNLGVEVIGVNELPETSRAERANSTEEEEDLELFTENDFVVPTGEVPDVMQPLIDSIEEARSKRVVGVADTPEEELHRFGDGLDLTSLLSGAGS